MSKITTDEQFIEHLGKTIGIGPLLASYYWFETSVDWSQVQHAFGMDREELNKWIEDKIGYRGDPDNSDAYFQHLYAHDILSWEAIDYITQGKHLPDDKVFMCIWGDGYVEYDADVLIECHGYPFFEKGYVSDDQRNQILNLNLGGSIEVKGMLDIMSVVRVS